MGLTPDWIKALDPTDKNSVTRAIGRGFEDIIRDTGSLIDDGLRGIGRGLDDYIFHPIGDFLGWTSDDHDDPVIEEPNLVNKSSNTEHIPVIYGQSRIGATRIFVSSSGENKEYMHIVCVLCEGEIESIDEVWINDIKSTDIIYSGLLTIPKDLNGTVGARTRYGYVGTTTQAADAVTDGLIDSTEWTTDHQLKGVAYVYIKLKQDRNVFSGLPTFLFDVRGKRVYDPRDSSTGYSQNPALCIRDYLTNDLYGKGLATSKIDDTKIASAADHCDTRMNGHEDLPDANSVTIDGAISVGDYSADITGITGGEVKAGDTFTVPNDTTQYLIIAPSAALTSSGTINFLPAARTAFSNGAIADFQMNYFEINGIISTKVELFKNIKLMLSSFRATLPKLGSKYLLIIEKDETSGFNFNKDNIVGAWSFRKGGKRSRKNLVKAKFSNPSSNWRSDIVHQSSNAYRTEDGGERLEVTVNLPLETNPYRALYIANTILKRSRQDIFVSFTATIAAYNVTAGDVVTITHDTPGWVSKTFRVLTAKLDPTGMMAITLQEHEPLVYDRAAEAGVSFPLDTTLPNPFHERVKDGLAELQASNWTNRFATAPVAHDLSTIACGSNYYVAAGESVGQITAGAFVVGLIYVITLTGSTNFTLIGAADSNVGTKFTATGVGSGTGKATEGAYMLYSPDGIEWTRAVNPKSFGIQGIHFADNLFVAVGSADGTDAYIITSSNAIDWTEQTNPKNKLLSDIAYGGSKWVAVGWADGSDSYVVTSSDGASWAEKSTGSDNADLEAITYGNGKFVAVGEARSPTNAGSFVTNTVYHIRSAGTTDFTAIGAANNNVGTRFTATGAGSGTGTATEGALILTSDDSGETWTRRANPKNDRLDSVVFGNGLFIAAGYWDATDSYLITSPDGIVWTEISVGFKYWFRDIVFANGLFVAVGSPQLGLNAIKTSVDGQSWKEVVNPMQTIMYGICYSTELGAYVIVGSDNGTYASIGTSLILPP